MASTDPGSLDNLHDFVLPDPVGIFPLAPVWKFVIAMAIVWLIAWVWMWFLRYARNAYRRQAILELNAIEADGDILRLNELLKRTAMTAYGRDEVASLYGERWVNFLTDISRFGASHGSESSVVATGASAQTANPVVQALATASTQTQPIQLTTTEQSDLFTSARHWITHHPAEALAC